MEEVWRTGVVPQDWKDAELVPLDKKGDQMRCDNHCEISLLNLPKKVLSLILLVHLKMEAQCSFREKLQRMLRYNRSDFGNQRTEYIIRTPVVTLHMLH